MGRDVLASAPHLILQEEKKRQRDFKSGPDESETSGKIMRPRSQDLFISSLVWLASSSQGHAEP